MRRIILAAAIVLVTSSAWSQYLDPQALMDRLLRDTVRKDEERRREEAWERYYRSLSSHDLMVQLRRYCPSGEPPCEYEPPDALLAALMRRGLIEPKSTAPPTVPDYSKYGTPVQPATNSLSYTPQDGRMSGVPGGLKCADLLNNGREVCFFTITIGKIGIDTVESVKKLLDYKHRSSRLIGGSAVFLNSPGGDVYPAMEIGRILRKERLPIWIEKDAKCVSACVLILAAAERRTMRAPRTDPDVQLSRIRRNSNKLESVSKSLDAWSETPWRISSSASFAIAP
jgi:hypothetical protein